MLDDLHLETQRLIMRPFDFNDSEQLHQILSQKEVMRYLPEDVMSLKEVKGTISWLKDCYGKNSPERIIKLTLATVWKENQKVIGWCGLGPLEFSPKEIEIYYGLSKDYWGKGIGTEAAKAMLGYGFDTFKLDPIVAITKPENIASTKVLEKLGMIYRKEIGKLPEKYRFYEGCFYYSISKDEYLGSIGKRDMTGGVRG
jgi:ribosomal-protein-alanine N-acetyltransferase